MSAKIQVLQDDVVNKIAAGEVVENPASVVKELIENALDAKALDIIVEIQGGGRQLIRITDTGHGMRRDDALLAIERHATSKITHASDLHQLHTMGFRGEALPSIASISKFTLITSPEESKEEGTYLFIDGGRLIKHIPYSSKKGTSIEVRSLFFNVPVRKKFLRSPAHDASEVYKVVSLMALGNPSISFRFIRDGKVVFCTEQKTGDFFDLLLERIRILFGEEYGKQLLSVENCEGEFLLRGFVGKPSETRSNRTGQTLFINQRPINSPLISKAVREAYGTTIPMQRHPNFVLHLTMPSHLVDVNVHPQKREVRLRNEEDLILFITRSVSKALQGKKEKLKANFSFKVTPSFSITQPKQPISIDQGVEPLVWQENKEEEWSQVTFPLGDKIYSWEGPELLASIQGFLIANPQTLQENPSKGLMLFHLRRSHHRILFDAVKEKEEIGSQRLAVPIQIEIPETEVEKWREAVPYLENYGFEVRELGKQLFTVDAVPDLFSKRDLPTMIKNIVEDHGEYLLDGGLEWEKEKQLASIAYRGAMSMDTKLTMDEGKDFIRQLFMTNHPDRCPLGHPTWTILSQNELENFF